MAGRENFPVPSSTSPLFRNGGAKSRSRSGFFTSGHAPQPSTITEILWATKYTYSETSLPLERGYCPLTAWKPIGFAPMALDGSNMAIAVAPNKKSTFQVCRECYRLHASPHDEGNAQTRNPPPTRHHFPKRDTSLLASPALLAVEQAQRFQKHTR